MCTHLFAHVTLQRNGIKKVHQLWNHQFHILLAQSLWTKFSLSHVTAKIFFMNGLSIRNNMIGHRWNLKTEILWRSTNMCPAGHNGDAFHELEWHLCFNLGKIKLVHKWNGVLYQLYVALKMLLKEIRVPESKDTASYMMKNIMFLMCKMHPHNEFTSESLIYWVQKALQMLRNSVNVNFLLYYIITSRHPLKSLTVSGKTVLLDRLSDMIANPLLVFQCWKIHFAWKLFHRGCLIYGTVKRI